MVGSGTNTAIYCRLSRDDGNEESQSISTQKGILTEYVKKQGWDIYDIYIDDGYSGTNFDRPDFLRLLDDIEIGKINIVITKDLSRLGRNYIQTGYYTEEYFPEHNVRYIALNDSFDTEKEETNDFAPFKNIINEWYAKDISKKIRFTLDNKAKNGEPRNTVFPLFGYTYNSKYERIPDPETGPIVKMIFELYKETGSSARVAQYLKENHIKMPCYYNAIKFNYNKSSVLARKDEELENWRPSAVRKVLKNREYLGIYITAKSKSKNFKTKTRDRYNKQCYEFEGRYEPLVDEDTFNQIQKMLANSYAGTVPIERNIFKGIVYCADCDRTLRFCTTQSKKKDGTKRETYYCFHKDCETGNTINITLLKNSVKDDLLQLKKIILNHKEEFREFAKNYNAKGRKINVDNSNEIKKYTKKSEDIDKYIQTLLEQQAKGRVPESTFETLMNKYSTEKNNIEMQLYSLVSHRGEKNDDDRVNYPYEAEKIIAELESLTEENVLEPARIRACINKIIVKAFKERKFGIPKSYGIQIKYRRCDTMIKEFMINVE